MLKAFEKLEANRRAAIEADRAAFFEAVELLAKLDDDKEPAKGDLAKIEALLARLGRGHERLRQAVELRRQQFELQARLATRPDAEADVKQAIEEIDQLVAAEQDAKTKHAARQAELREEQDSLRARSGKCSSTGEREEVLAKLRGVAQALRESSDHHEEDRSYYDGAKARARSRLQSHRNVLDGLTEAARELAALQAKEQSLAPS